MMHLKKNRKLLTEYGNATQQHGVFVLFLGCLGEKKKKTNSCKTDLMSHIKAICLVKINHQY